MLMRTITIIICLLAFLALPGVTCAQDNDEWPSLSYLRSDYSHVAVVMRVRVREAEVVKTIGGYEDWHIVADVVEPFKGKFRKGQTVEYYHGAEKGFRKELFLGDKIVFLYRNFVQQEKRWVYAVLENSTLPYNEDRGQKLRRIMRSAKQRTTRKN
jgi:hypothetical protein